MDVGVVMSDEGDEILLLNGGRISVHRFASGATEIQIGDFFGSMSSLEGDESTITAGSDEGFDDVSTSAESESLDTDLRARYRLTTNKDQFRK